MGLVFSTNLVQDRISGAVSVAVSVINQCSQTLSSVQGLNTNGCPGLFLAGLSFAESQIITEKCATSDSIVSQIQIDVSDYLQRQADSDIAKFKFTAEQAKEYKQLLSNLNDLIVKNTVGFTEDFFNENAFVCKNTPINISAVETSELDRFLSNKVYVSVLNSKVFTDLNNFFKTTGIISQRNQDLFVVFMISILLFIIMIVLLFLGISCGWVIIASLIIFLILEFSI